MKRLTKRRLRFVQVFWTEAEGSPSKAAAIAGFACPESVGSRMAKSLSKELEEKRIEVLESAQVSPKECLTMLGDIARTASHKDRLRAIELLLKVHGLLSDKLQVTVDRKSLIQELDRQITRLGVIDVTAKPSSPLEISE